MGFQIRTANDADLDLLIEFQIKMAMETEGQELASQTLQKGVSHLLGNAEIGYYLVATHKEEVIASTLVLKEWSDWRNGNVLWVHSVYVLPEYRGKGVFKQIYAHIKDQVLKDESLMGIRLYVDKTNTAAQSVYKAIGMDGDHYKMFEWMKDY